MNEINAHHRFFRLLHPDINNTLMRIAIVFAYSPMLAYGLRFIPTLITSELHQLVSRLRARYISP